MAKTVVLKTDSLGDFALDVARAKVPFWSGVNKFGQNINLSSDTLATIWSGPTDEFVAPTQARIHDIVSTGTGDNYPSGTGAQTVEVIGLRDWDQPLTSETIQMNGTTNVPTVNSYVIINSIVVTHRGTLDVNEGTITATAQVDATVSAQIERNVGRSQNAILGVSSQDIAYIKCYFGSVGRSTKAALDLLLMVVRNPIDHPITKP